MTDVFEFKMRMLFYGQVYKAFIEYLNCLSVHKQLKERGNIK